MLGFLLKKIIGTKNERELRRMAPVIGRINALEPRMQQLTDAELRGTTEVFRRRLADGATLEELIPEAFAAVREASRRTIGLRHFDVQLIGGLVLHEGTIAEMKTGEGKTLVATLPIYLNALTGRGVHLVTVNDYLAKRDVQWMGPIYHALGLTVATIVHEASYVFDPAYLVEDYRFLHLRPISRREAYLADVTHGTNSEFGFDYLRDNMKFALDEMVQRELHYAIVDEVDNILIDEARTPLIISGPSEESTDRYARVNGMVPILRREVDYTVDEKVRTVTLTEEGVAKVERRLGVSNLYDPSQIETLHHVNQALRAHVLYKRDVDYVVKENQVIIVDEFTGRLMPGRRWSDGLHQAIEAKEGVRIQTENQTLASVTIQNYFRMYGKLAGMTGTADTEAAEFHKIYKLEVVVVPTHMRMIREDYPDVIYKTEREKFNAVIQEILDCHQRGQPVLVGTTSVEKSERLSQMLRRHGVKHQVLNAVNHEAEAEIIAQAGRYAGVTIATNMAGRGTDILLGGNPELVARAESQQQALRTATPKGDRGDQGYAQALRDLRERRNKKIQHIEERYQPELRTLRERLHGLDERLVQAERRLFDLSPFRAERTAYDAATADLAQTIVVGAEIPAGYLEAKQALEQALAAIAEEAARPERAAFDEARHRLDRLLDAWVSGQRDEELRPVLNEVRDAYEQARRRLEQAILLSGQGLGEVDQETATALAEVCETCRGAEAEKEEAEKEYAKLLRTYEGKKREVEDEFERQRAKYERAMAEVREEMEKAPDRFRQLYEPILAKYREECNREREKVVAAGGVHILGTERHESRRIDNQLRGRSGRQGDPGSSRFYLSLEDDLLRIFGSDRIAGIMDKLGMQEDEPIEHRLVTRAIENAQKRVEAHNFEIRKHLLEYDDVMNQQRQVIYQQRKEIMRGETLREMVSDMVDELLEDIVDIYADEKLPPAEWDWKGLEEALFRQFCLRVPLGDEERESLTAEGLQERLREPVWRAYEAKEARFGPERLRLVERWVILRHVDSLWKDHLLNMDHLREGIGLRGYGQRDPLQEYKREAFDMFMELARQIKSGAVGELFRVELAQEAEAPVEVQRRPQRVFLGRGQGPQASEGPKTVRRDGKKVGRNDPCICGSGKKYKKCCGAAA